MDHVCAFVERNQVQWVDLHETPVEFDRVAIITSVVTTIACLRCNQRLKSQEDKSKKPTQQDKYGIGNEYFLLSIFDEIMNTMARVNGKRIWMCKSMGMSQYHDMLLTFYGKERLRYIYLVRDPRDVCKSFQKTPVGDCHPYNIAKKWTRLQNNAAEILARDPDLVHTVHYEDALADSDAEVAKVIDFMGARETCKTMRRGSVCAFKDEQEITETAKCNRESVQASTLSYQFQNLTKGKEFAKTQLEKSGGREMNEEDLRIVESVAHDVMSRLGYQPRLVKTSEDRLVFTDEHIENYERMNKELIQKMYADLAVENPADLKRRTIQASVLKVSRDYKYDKLFMLNFSPKDRDELYDTDDLTDDDSNMEGVFNVNDVDKFSSWPQDASKAGYLSNEEADERCEIHPNQTIKVGKYLSIFFAAASQGGYYPCNRTKANQDAFSSCIIKDPCSASKSKKNFGALFSVFDGHGGKGTECSLETSHHVTTHVVSTLEETIEKTKHEKAYDLSHSIHMRSMDPRFHSIDRSNRSDLSTTFHRSMHIDFDDSNCEEAEHESSNNTLATRRSSLSSSIASSQEGEIPNISNLTMIQGNSKKEVIANQIPIILADSFTSANQKLLEDPRGIAESAGTTATSLVVTSKHFHIANVGDSRCLLITKSKGKVEVDQVTAEHNTDSPTEVERINEMGGVVMTSNQYDLGCATDMSASNETKRVWSKDGKYPGTAFTRSIGDGNAKDLGVTAEPECVSIPITQKDTMFVLGTDGIFDFISNDEVADIVLDCDEDLEKACRSLVGMAYSRWTVNEERTDDITVIVGQVHNSKKEFFHKLKQILPNRMYK